MNLTGWLCMITSLALMLGVTITAWWTLWTTRSKD